MVTSQRDQEQRSWSDTADARRVIIVDLTGTEISSHSTDQLLLDKASSTITYVGVATRGTATSAAAWKIFKLDTTSGLSKKWASGAYDQVWDNRASLTYS